MAECCSGHSHDHHGAQPDGGSLVRDPVCGMEVDSATTTHRHDLGETTYYFCSARCREKFAADPDRYLNPSSTDPAVQHPAMGALPEAAAGTIWTCPMHPEIRRDAPGSCPICGMALEPLEPTIEEGPNPELIDMTRRFWGSAAFTIPLALLFI